ncbi:hypothetical protein K8M07_03585 [Schnuerera sp. xch1]|uniref:hypothetical protein n=1 Tax=Schnuerera sp. xch1 TaxID=2874283 RepID=UPI001CBBAD71|nr:hypothetical protein [Schnuerera sp. xch1]MBZ2174325.1 hypothetical protein [Schnuerera sp. xch1]
MTAEELLKSVTKIGAVSGDEFRLSHLLKDIFDEFGHEVFMDNIGNIILKINGKKNSQKAMIFSHIDEPGLIVTNIDDKGFLDFDIVGDINPKDLASQEVLVWGKKTVPGLLGLRPPHILSAKERKAPVTLEEMKIDIGFSKEKAKKYVNIGDTVTFKRRCMSFKDDTICAKALCDRIGIPVLYKTLLALKDIDMELYVVFGVQHYNSFIGATVAANEVKPDIALILDSVSSKTREDKLNKIQSGFGPAIYSGPTADSKLTKWLIKCAKNIEYDFKYQIKAASGKNPTDAWAIQIACGGIPTAILLTPVMYKYSSAEIVKNIDLDYTSKLLLNFIYFLDKKDWGELSCF